MESQITGQILGVAGRSLKNAKTIYDVAFGDGNKYSTFEQPIANMANGLVGQTVTATVDVSQNGQYTNYNLRGILAAGQAPPAGLPPGTPIPLPVASAPVTTPIPVASPSNGGWTPEKEQRVTKLAVFGTAYEFVGNLFAGAGPEAFEEASGLADTLARKLYQTVFLAAPQINATPETPQEVAAQVNAELPGAVVSGSDIPW